MFAILGRRFPRQAGPDHLAYAEHMFTRYGAGAVFFGRFVALLRMFAGPLAGALRMPYRRFLVANALGGLLWACGITAVLYTLGARASTWLSGSSWVALGLAIIIFVVVSTALRRRLENAVSRYAKERRAQQIEETNSQKMPPDSPSGEFVP
jgi:membrane protein DedA with SNARE-associated domain